jgi:hypothetical protein
LRPRDPKRDAASALAYFDDRVLDVGDFAQWLTFDLELTSNDPGARFTTQLVLGGVPEPEPLSLVAIGLALLSARSRAARARPRARARRGCQYA